MRYKKMRLIPWLLNSVLAMGSCGHMDGRTDDNNIIKMLLWATDTLLLLCKNIVPIIGLGENAGSPISDPPMGAGQPFEMVLS